MTRRALCERARTCSGISRTTRSVRRRTLNAVLLNGISWLVPRLPLRNVIGPDTRATERYHVVWRGSYRARAMGCH
jgi:hypothetical protein